MLNRKFHEVEGDALVFPFNPKVKLAEQGIVAKSILKFGGLEIQDEIDNQMKKIVPKEGELLITSGG